MRLPWLYSKFYPKFNLEEFYRISQEWDLNLTSKLDELSEGERKKFSIAFALSTNCKLILMDEPTNGLDIPAKDIFRRLIANYTAALDKTLIISSHQVRDLEGLIDPIIILDRGEIILSANLANIEAKLNFKAGSTLPTDNILYATKTVSGYSYVELNLTHELTQVDIELLFNAVVNNPYQIKNLWSKY